MRFKNTLVVFLIFLGLAAWVYFQEIKGGKRREEAKERSAKLMLFEKGDVQSFRLKSQEEEIVCQRYGDEWKITKPVETQGDKSVIDGLVSRLEGARIERVVEEVPLDVGKFGLKEPKLEVELTYEGGNRDTLWLGDKNPTNSFVYLQRSGPKKVLLASSGLLTSLGKNLFDLRDKRVLTFNRDEVKRISLTRGRSSIICETSDGDWELKEPIEAKGDKGVIDGLLSSLQSARAREFVSEKPEDLDSFGLKRPKVKVDLLLGEERAEKTLLIGKKKGERFYAKDESRAPVFLVDSSLVEKFKKEPFDLRDKTVVKFESDKVDKVEIRYPAELIICDKDTSGEWMMVEPDSTKAKKWKISSLFSNLSGLRTERFPSLVKELSRYGLKSPQEEIILYEGGKELVWIQLGKKKDDLVYLKDKLGGKMFMVKEKDADRLRLRPEDIEEKPTE